MKHSSVRIAKLHAVQAIVVALISSVLTLLTATGVKFIDNTAETSALKKQLQGLQAEKEQAIEKLTAENAELQEQATKSPVIVLYRTSTQLTQRECFKRTIDAVRQSTGGGPGGGAEKASFDAAGIWSSRPYMVRIACDPETKSAIVVVGAPLPVAEVAKVAKAVESALQQ